VVSDLPWDTTKFAISRVKCEEVTKKTKDFREDIENLLRKNPMIKVEKRIRIPVHIFQKVTQFL